MPKYVIHIGPPKAGSKYLQSCLASLRKRLGNIKILYPGTLMTPQQRATYAALDPLLRAGGPNPALERAFAEMNASDNRLVVLSWEGAYSLPEPAIAYLRSLIGPDSEVAVVYYLRRFSERLPSLWKQEIKAGRTVTLPEAVVRATRHPLEGVEYNATLSWDRWTKAFGRDSLHIVSLNNLREHKIDLFDHFAHTFLDWKGTARPKRPTVHEFPDAVDTEMTRTLNALHRSRASTEAGNIFITYQRLKPELEFGPIFPAMTQETAVLRLDDRAAAFLPVYDALLAYKDRLTSPEYGTDLFARGVTEVSYVRQDYLLHPGVMPAIQGIYRAVRAAFAQAHPAPSEAEAEAEEEAEIAEPAVAAAAAAARPAPGRGAGGGLGGGAKSPLQGGARPGGPAAQGARAAAPGAPGQAPKQAPPAGAARPGGGAARPAGAGAAKPPGAGGGPGARPKQATNP